MCLVYEGMKMPRFGWMELATRMLVAVVKGIITCNSMLVSHFKSRVIVGNWDPIVSIDFHEHYDWYDGFEAGICLGFWTFGCEETLPRDGSPEGLGISVWNAKELGR